MQKDQTRTQSCYVTPLIPPSELLHKSSPTSESSPRFNNKATLNCSVKRAASALPKCILKKVKVIHKIITDLSPVKPSTLSKMMRWKNNDSSKRRKILLSDEKKLLILDFLISEGMSYAR